MTRSPATSAIYLVALATIPIRIYMFLGLQLYRTFQQWCRRLALAPSASMRVAAADAVSQAVGRRCHDSFERFRTIIVRTRYTSSLGVVDLGILSKLIS